MPGNVIDIDQVLENLGAYMVQVCLDTKRGEEHGAKAGVILFYARRGGTCLLDCIEGSIVVDSIRLVFVIPSRYLGRFVPFRHSSVEAICL